MQIKFTLLSVTVLSLLFFYCGHAQQKSTIAQFSAVQIKNYHNAELTKRFTNYTSIHLPSADIAGFCKNNFEKKDIRLSLTKDISFDLQLEHSTIVSPGYKLYIQTDTGLQVISTHPDFLYKGKTKAGGDVRLAIKEGFISGSIHADDKEYFIEPMKQYASDAESDAFIFYEAADVIASALNCDEPGTGNSSNERVEGGSCKTANVFNLADYSIYQHYGNSIEAVENFLLTNLNNVEGVFNGFNFDPADPSDTGTDFVLFHVIATHISTCPTCDFADSSNSFGSLVNQLRNGFFVNLGLTLPFTFMPHIWTMRPINTGISQVAGVTSGYVFMRHVNDDPLYLRLVAAHETGHFFGCQHDNEVKPGVRSFIMYSAASTNATRFSRLSDFGGLDYSSNLTIKNTVLKPGLFLSDCTAPECDRVKDITVQYSANRGPQIRWTGNDRVSVNYKLKNSTSYDPTTAQFVNTGTVVLNNLSSCEDYEIEIKKECSTNVFGPVEFVHLNTGSVQLNTFTMANRRNDRYDLSCKASGNTRLMQEAVITVDHIAIPFVFDSVTLTLSVNSLFADGARHRIDINDHNNQRFCTDPFYFQAPYYRDNSTAALVADFNNCGYPAGWHDTVYQVKPDASVYGFTVDAITSYTTIFNQGTLDSSCMAFCIPLGTANSKLVFQSPETDLSILGNTMLCFDYNFTSFQIASGYWPKGTFSVEGFDGAQWKKLYSYQKVVAIKPVGRYISVWDTIPARKFIPLDSFYNKNFKIRFTVDDGAFLDSVGTLVHALVMAALDNIRIDGYPKDAVQGTNPISIFPNPVRDLIYIKYNIPANTVISYRIMDVLGRQYDAGKLINKWIDAQHLKRGIYIVQFFTNDKKLYSAKVFKQ